eukprot:6098676-Amphidinium_carterae.2
MSTSGVRPHIKTSSSILELFVQSFTMDVESSAHGMGVAFSLSEVLCLSFCRQLGKCRWLSVFGRRADSVRRSLLDVPHS